MIKRKIDPQNLVWKNEYNIGNYKVDIEHQRLFNLAKKALTIRTLDNDKKELNELKKIIKSLYEYVSIHFKHEEAYMQKIDYPELQKHKEIHQKMLNTLNVFILSLANIDIDEIEQKLYQFIEDYFIHHIVNEDMEIGVWAFSLDRLKHSNSWKLNYATGNEIIDQEHQELFKILQEAFIEVEDNEREKKIKNVLKHLYDFMKEHFQNEEDLMKKISYPEYEKHKTIHDQIIESSNELLHSIDITDKKLFEKRLALFIDEHIVNHMIYEDKKIVEFENPSNNMTKEEEKAFF